jgi:hypothetical protein
MKKVAPTDAEIVIALSRCGGSIRGAARILGCCRARVAAYVRSRQFEVPLADDAPGGPLTESELMSLEALREFMAEELA